MAITTKEGACLLESGWFTVSNGGVQPDAVCRRLSPDSVQLRRFRLEGVHQIILY
ncbi:MAG: hypothetical protein LLF96_07335 [Eubacteriales bacterium]|nr:hypothetical protein [Eubacteriales bacterium]